MINKFFRALLLVVSVVAYNNAQAATVSFNVNAQTVALGSNFSLSIQGTEFPTIVGGGLDLTFNSSVLQITSVTINTSVFEFYIGNGMEEGVLNNVLGTLTDTAFNTFAGATGDFTVMTIGFTSVGAGTSLLNLSESSVWVFSDVLGNPIGNQITFAESLITVSAVPLPAAVWLFGTGLLGLAALMRKRCQIQ